MEKTHAIVSRVPPNSSYNGMWRVCASRSRSPFSMAALAMRWPRTGRNIPGHLPPLCSSAAVSNGTSSCKIVIQAVSVDSSLKYGCSPVVHSPQPESPSARTSTNSTRRSLVSPKLVAKGWIKDMLSSRRTIDSIFMKTCSISVYGECWGPDGSRISGRGPVGVVQTSCGLQPLSELIDAVALGIDPKTNYCELLGEGVLKMLAIPGLNVKDALLIRG